MSPIFLNVAAGAEAMRAGLHSTLLVELPPGAAFRQTTPALLLRGQMAALPPARQAGAAAPAVLPWPVDAWPDQKTDAGSGVKEQECEERLWWAGPEGAMLLVWLTPEGREPPGVAEAAAAGPSPAAARQAALHSGEIVQSATSSGGGSSARRLMPWQHPFVRRRPAE